ncbi:MAG: hypothetical protein RMX96_22260 [Nostoc sp. ChiSLP02]|nr:hypothetical protein [Nostoc sp. ChiSLP02]
MGDTLSESLRERIREEQRRNPNQVVEKLQKLKAEKMAIQCVSKSIANM